LRTNTQNCGSVTHVKVQDVENGSYRNEEFTKQSHHKVQKLFMNFYRWNFLVLSLCEFLIYVALKVEIEKASLKTAVNKTIRQQSPRFSVLFFELSEFLNYREKKSYILRSVCQFANNNRNPQLNVGTLFIMELCKSTTPPCKYFPEKKSMR